MSGAYDDLYSTKQPLGWYEKLSPACKKWLDGLVDHIEEHGEPVWMAVHRHLAEHFPADCPKTDTTVREQVRRLVALRG